MTRIPAAAYCLFLLTLTAGIAAPVFAQTHGATSVVAVPPQPAWQDLNETQQQILAPLAEDWNRMENYRRKKWLGIAQRYPRMAAKEQERVQRRMLEWANMTPEQRQNARETYKNLNQLPPERKSAVKQKWEEYQNLPEAQRQQLKEAAVRSAPPAPRGLAGAFAAFTLGPATPQAPRPAAGHRAVPPGLAGKPASLRPVLPPLPRPPFLNRSLREGKYPSLLPPMPQRRPAPDKKKP